MDQISDNRLEEYYRNLRVMATANLHEIIAAKIQAILPPGSTIVDYGAGEGALSQRLADLGYGVVAVDLVGGDFKANTEFHQVDFNDAEACQEFIRRFKNKFDLAIGIEVIEHVEDPWQYIRDLKDLVKPGGTLIVSTPNVASWYSRMTFFFKGRLLHFEDDDLEYGHINPVFANEIRLICEKNGLLVQEIFPVGGFQKLWLYKSFKRILAILLGRIGYPFMGGIRDGWCIVAVIKKP